MEEFRAALDLNPNLVIIHYHLGRFLMDQGNLYKAEKELKEFISLAQDQPPLRDEIEDAKRRLDKLNVFEE
jgi:tetratricopeptide (TPR) repeat protein